jgi:outer membrane murein-binding lipoprotein Lpp
MTETIIVAIIVSVLSLAGTIVGARAGIREANKLTNYRIECLEKKMDVHNCLITRMAVAEQDIKVANHRIDDLEKIS